MRFQGWFRVVEARPSFCAEQLQAHVLCWRLPQQEQRRSVSDLWVCSSQTFFQLRLEQLHDTETIARIYEADGKHAKCVPCRYICQERHGKHAMHALDAL